MEKILISPSILSANFLHLEDEILNIQNAGASFLHFDVMDGHFVNNISFGIPVLKSIGHKFKLVNDVHLMISDPKKYYLDFIKAGADILTVHYESFSNEEEIFEIIDLIKKEGIKVGLSIKPKTSVENIIKFLDKLDLVLVMSVEPGFGGQSFIETSTQKIKDLSDYKINNNLKYLIEVDGGINENTAKICKNAGAHVLVAGSYIFNSENYLERIESLKNE